MLLAAEYSPQHLQTDCEQGIIDDFAISDVYGPQPHEECFWKFGQKCAGRLIDVILQSSGSVLAVHWNIYPPAAVALLSCSTLYP